MTRQPTETVAPVATKETLPQLRRRMIRETEAFLNERLFRQNGRWETHSGGSARLNPRDDRHDRRQQPPRAEQSIDVRMWPEWGTHIVVRPNESGIVDDPRLDALEIQLRELTGDRTAGDIVIGVEQVAVMTAGFMSLLAAIRPRLICQNRKLSLHGLRPQCALVLQDTGLEDLAEPPASQPALVASLPYVFGAALRARSRGGERAA